MSDSAENSANLLAGLARGESLPARWYTDPAITEREIHQIFRKTWNYIGPLNELEKIGDYITGYVGEIPVVVRALGTVTPLNTVNVKTQITGQLIKVDFK